jgi:hypothetical protein
LREPQEIFVGVLDEGAEVELVSGLKLCRRLLHGEPVIELCGADPYRFAELRRLGLLNEQVDWKQRFFVPTEQEKGIAVLDGLLARYPIMAEEVATESETTCIEPEELSRSQTVNLDEWFVRVAETALVAAAGPAEIADTEAASSLPTLYFTPSRAPGDSIPLTQLALDFG